MTRFSIEYNVTTREASVVPYTPEQEAEADAAYAAEQAAKASARPELAPYQFRAMLKLSGKEQQLMAVLNGLPEPAKTVALAKLEYSLQFRRDNDLVEQARQAMGLTTEALDKLWLQAAAIE